MVREVPILQDIKRRQQLLDNHIIDNHIIEVQVRTERPPQLRGQLSKEVLLTADLLRVNKEATEHRQLLRQEATEHRQLLRQEVLQATEAAHLQEVLVVIVEVVLQAEVEVQVLQAVLQVQVVLQAVDVKF